MHTTGSLVRTKITRGFERFLRPPIRSRELLSSLVAMILLCAFSVLLVAKAWSHISVWVVWWIAFSMFWEVQLFRTILRVHGSLQMLLATYQVDPKDEKSPLGAVLDIVSDVSNQLAVFNLFSTFALLMGMAYILPGR